METSESIKVGSIVADSMAYNNTGEYDLGVVVEINLNEGNEFPYYIVFCEDTSDRDWFRESYVLSMIKNYKKLL